MCVQINRTLIVSGISPLHVLHQVYDMSVVYAFTSLNCFRNSTDINVCFLLILTML